MMQDLFSGAHLHLLVNHAPIFGAFLAVALLVTARFAGGDVLRRTALVLLVGTAVAAAAANYTGEGAEDAVRGLPGVSRELIHEHEEAAEGAFLAAEILGVVALIALLRWRRRSVPRAVTVVALTGGIVVAGWMAYAGLLGGRVRHTEVRPGASEVAIPRASKRDGSTPDNDR